MMNTEENTTDATDVTAVDTVTDAVTEQVVDTPEDPEEQPEQQPALADPEPKTYTSDDIDTLIAEAEQRGYLRGRNEQIDRLISTQRPMWQSSAHVSSLPADDTCVVILDNVRPSIWDL